MLRADPALHAGGVGGEWADDNANRGVWPVLTRDQVRGEVFGGPACAERGRVWPLLTKERG